MYRFCSVSSFVYIILASIVKVYYLCFICNFVAFVSLIQKVGDGFGEELLQEAFSWRYVDLAIGKYFQSFVYNFLMLSEQLRTQNRELRKAQRDIERSQREMDRQEKQLEAEIKKAAKSGNKAVCGILAKQLVNLRKQKTRYMTIMFWYNTEYVFHSRCYVASSQIGAVGNQAKVLHFNLSYLRNISVLCLG